MMKQQEKIAFDYLSGRDAGQVVYEPDGGVSPDFLIGDIAVETTAMHPMFVNKDGTKTSIYEDINTIYRAFSEDIPLKSKDVRIVYALRLSGSVKGKIKVIKRSLQRELERFEVSDDECWEDVILSDGISVSLDKVDDFGREGFAHKTIVSLGANWLVASFLHSLQHCIDKKAKKKTEKYDKWELILTNKTFTTKEDIAFISPDIDIDKKCFEKVVVINQDGEEILSL